MKTVTHQSSALLRPTTPANHRPRRAVSAPLQPTRSRLRPILIAVVNLLLLGALSVNKAGAQTTWAYTGTGNLTWETAGSWSPASVPDNAGAIVTIFNNAAGTRNVTIGSSHTVYNLAAGRGGANSSRMYIFGGAGVITLASTNGLKPLVGQNSSFGYQEYPLVLAGTNGVRFGGGATMVVGGNNTFTNDVEFNRSTTRITHVNALPHGSRLGNVTFVNSGSGYGTMDVGVSLTINGLSSPALGAGTITTTTAGTVILTVGDNDQGGGYGGIIQNGSGTLGLSKIGAGTLVLSNANTYSGPTSITGGKLALKEGGAISASSTISVGNGGGLDVTGLTTLPFAINFAQTLAGSGGTGTIDGDVNVDSGANLSFNYTAGTPMINVASGTTTLNANPTTVNVQNSPLLSGSYPLITKSGSGALAGTTGTLTVGGLGIIGGGTPSLGFNGGGELVLTVAPGAPVLEWGTGAGTWAIGAAGWNSGGAAIYADNDAILLSDVYSTGNPTLTLNSTVLPQSIFVVSTNHYTISGTGDIGGSTEIRKLSTGALTLDTTNSFTGGVTLYSGTLNVRNPNSLGAVSAPFTINSGTIDNTSGSPLTLVDYNQSWNGNFTFTGSSSLNLGAGAATMSAARTLTVSASTLTVGGSINGGFGLNKSGAGTLQLDGNNNFTGTLTINLGEVIVGNDGALNSGAPVPVAFPTDTNTKILSLNGHTLTLRNLSMGVIAGGTATVVRNNHPSTPVLLTVNCTTASTFAGTITDGDAAPLSLTKIGTANWTLGGAGVGVASYSGDTIFSAGTVTAGANNILPFGAGKGNITVNGTFDILDRGAMGMNGLNGSGTVDRSNPGGSPNSTLTLGNNDASGSFSGRIRTTGANAGLNVIKTGTGTQILAGANDYVGLTTVNGGVLQIGAGGTGGSLTSTSIVNNASVVFNRDGALTYAGYITGPGWVTNAGPGIVSLTGTNLYTGLTVLNAGTFRVNNNGSLAPASSVTVNSGATLGGTGKIQGAVSVEDGGFLAPGASVGTLTVTTNLTLAANSTSVFEIDLNAFTSDKVIGLSNITYNGTLIVTNIGLADAVTNGTTFKLFTALSYTGSFATSNLVSLPGYTLDTSTLAVDGSVKLVYGGPTTPTNITYSVTGDQMTLSWPDNYLGWRLQAQTNAVDAGISSTWFTVPGSASASQVTLTVDPANGSVFFRLAAP